VLFRQADEGLTKASVAVRQMRELNPDVRAHAIDANVLAAAGLGVFHWADVVIGAVDNREARVFINSACARTGRAWVDGAIEGLAGVVRVFRARSGRLLRVHDERHRSPAPGRAALVRAPGPGRGGARPRADLGGAASIIGAMEVEEAIKLVHGQPTLVGAGLHVDGLMAEVSRVTYPRRVDCPGHEHLGPLVPLGLGVADVTLGALLDRAEARSGRARCSICRAT
jgi:molybdopterin/thiamine biosynthesis adenylyltransferase